MDNKETKQSASLGQKTIHEEDGPVTSIFICMGAELGPRAKPIAEAAAYSTEGSSSSGETASTGAQERPDGKKLRVTKTQPRRNVERRQSDTHLRKIRWFCCS